MSEMTPVERFRAIAKKAEADAEMMQGFPGSSYPREVSLAGLKAIAFLEARIKASERRLDAADRAIVAQGNALRATTVLVDKDFRDDTVFQKAALATAEYDALKETTQSEEAAGRTSTLDVLRNVLTWMAEREPFHVHGYVMGHHALDPIEELPIFFREIPAADIEGWLAKQRTNVRDDMPPDERPLSLKMLLDGMYDGIVEKWSGEAAKMEAQIEALLQADRTSMANILEKARRIQWLEQALRSAAGHGERLLGRFVHILPALTDQDIRLVRQMRALLARCQRLLPRPAEGRKED